jgi:hypothetical protein
VACNPRSSKQRNYLIERFNDFTKTSRRSRKVELAHWRSGWTLVTITKKGSDFDNFEGLITQSIFFNIIDRYKMAD